MGASGVSSRPALPPGSSHLPAGRGGSTCTLLQAAPSLEHKEAIELSSRVAPAEGQEGLRVECFRSAGNWVQSPHTPHHDTGPAVPTVSAGFALLIDAPRLYF